MKPPNYNIFTSLWLVPRNSLHYSQQLHIATWPWNKIQVKGRKANDTHIVLMIQNHCILHITLYFLYITCYFNIFFILLVMFNLKIFPCWSVNNWLSLWAMCILAFVIDFQYLRTKWNYHRCFKCKMINLAESSLRQHWTSSDVRFIN